MREANEKPISQLAQKRSERREAKFIEDVDKIIAEGNSRNSNLRFGWTVALDNPKRKNFSNHKHLGASIYE